MIILNNTRDTFSLLPNGSLVTAVVLDREQQAEYILTIVDQEGQSVPIAVVWITVTDVPDTTPVFSQQDSLYTVPSDLLLMGYQHHSGILHMETLEEAAYLTVMVYQ